MVIPLGMAVLLAGTVAFVVTLTVLARAVDRLIDIAIAARGGSTDETARRPATRPRRRRFAALPRTVLAAIVAGLLLFALAWSTFVLGRVRELG